MEIPTWQVDAFATRPFTGNPAAVCLLAEQPSPTWMQAVAAERNLSETAFAWLGGDDPSTFGIRYYTPTVEVALCGHATLAAAHVLWEDRRAPRRTPIRFVARDDVVHVHYQHPRLSLDFPARPAVPVATPSGLARALGAAPVTVASLPVERGLLVELRSEAEVHALRPDLGAIVGLELDTVAVTAQAAPSSPSGPNDGGPPVDFVSRFFAPGLGIDEDPVTGVSHATLGPWWGARLGRERLFARQISQRGGELEIVLHGDRVEILGHAVTVLTGRLHA